MCDPLRDLIHAIGEGLSKGAKGIINAELTGTLILLIQCLTAIDHVATE